MALVPQSLPSNLWGFVFVPNTILGVSPPGLTPAEMGGAGPPRSAGEGSRCEMLGAGWERQQGPFWRWRERSEAMGPHGSRDRAAVEGPGLRSPARSSALTLARGGGGSISRQNVGAGQGLRGAAHTGDVAVDSLHRLSTMSARWMRRRAARRASSVALSWAAQLASRARTGQASWVKESMCSGW